MEQAGIHAILSKSQLQGTDTHKGLKHSVKSCFGQVSSGVAFGGIPPLQTGCALPREAANRVVLFAW
jgi:hypothetical protein